jgi:hypothetical protein
MLRAGGRACIGGCVWRRRCSRSWAASTALAGPLAPLPEVEGGAEIAIRRGPDAGMYLKVRPPLVVGPYSNMVIRKGRISGIHCGGGLDVTAGPGRISGFGRAGAWWRWRSGATTRDVNVEGLWNGAYGHLESTPESCGCRWPEPTRVERGPVIAARHRSYSFRRAAEGLFTGTPTVNGTAQWTTLEVGRECRAYLSREELLALVMMMFAGASTPAAAGRPLACGARWTDSFTGRQIALTMSGP